jgi:hypothetical protein
MIDPPKIAVRTFLVVSLMASSARVAYAYDLDGAWATDSSQCSKVFVRKGDQVVFSGDSDVYGGGFIVSGDQITGKYAKCKIRVRKDDGQKINLLAACASDVMLQNVQLSAKVLDSDSIIRMFPGMDEIEIKYYRCSMK